MKTFGNILIFLSGLSTQIPFILLYKEDSFLPPFEDGNTLYLISIEVLTIVIFAMALLNRERVKGYAAKAFNRKIYILLGLFFLSGILYSMVLLNFVFESTTERVVIPIFQESKMREYLTKPPREQDVASITEYIQETPFNRNMWFLTYILFFALYCVFFSAAILLISILGIRLLSKGFLAPEDESAVKKKHGLEPVEV